MKKLHHPFQPTLTESGLKSFGLLLKYSSPSEILKDAVHSYLQVHATRPTPYPVMPDGTQAIFISPYGSMIGGAQTKACEVQMLQPGDYFGIRFYPGALRHFFSMNLSEITDQFADNHYLPCNDFGELHKSIYQHRSFHQRTRVCEQWLLKYYKPQPSRQFDQALSLINQSFGNVRVAQLADMVGWSSRHLNRLFQQHTGLSTKTFIQTIRIQHVCKQLYLAPTDSLNTAYEFGFFDQPHLIKDFKKRLLANPGTFFNRFMSDFYNR